MQTAICALLACTVVGLGVFGAGVFPWTLNITAVLLCAACATLACRGSSGGNGDAAVCADPAAGAVDRAAHHHRTLFWSVVAFVAFLILTAIPLPPCLDAVVPGHRHLQNELVRDVIRDAGNLGLAETREPWFALTRNLAGTMRMILLVISGLAMAALSSRLSGEWKARYLKTIVLVGMIIAVAGYASQWVVPQKKTIWWLVEVEHGRPVGCFVNRNHFGGFVAMLCPAALTFFADAFQRRRLFQALLWGIGFGVMSIAVIMSLSRGAWISYGMVMSAVVCLLVFRRGHFLAAVGITALIACLFAGLTLVTNEKLQERAQSMAGIQESPSARMRFRVWGDSLRILPDYAVVGTGANAFHMVLPQYRTDTERKHFRFAENEYVQMTVEGGFVGLILIAVVGACFVMGWRESEMCGLLNATVAMSVGGAIAVAAVHAFFDFALRIPLYFMVLTSLAGLVLSPSKERLPSQGKRRRAIAPAVGLIVALIISLYGTRTYLRDDSMHLEKSGTEELCRALVWSPASWQVWYHLGSSTIAARGQDAVSLAERCITRAVEYDPQNYILWQRLSMLRLSLGDRDGALKAYEHVKRLRSWVRIRELE